MIGTAAPNHRSTGGPEPVLREAEEQGKDKC